MMACASCNLTTPLLFPGWFPPAKPLPGHVVSQDLVHRAGGELVALVNEDWPRPLAAIVHDGRDRLIGHRIIHASSHFAAAARDQQQA